MAYTTNPHLPTVRMKVVRLVCYRGWSMRKTARHIGVEPSTISRWVKKDPTGGWRRIPTESSRPHHHPKQLNRKMVRTVIAYRQKHQRCAKVLHFLLKQDGYKISLSSIERILRRYQLVNHSKWKKWHSYPPRPLPKKPGLLVQLDTIWDGPHFKRLYVYSLLDVCSRWAYALPAERANSWRSIEFLNLAQKKAPFEFKMIQTDHGSEFSKQFTKVIEYHGIKHRHSRVRRPTDNGHVERFNRTIQEECLNRIDRSMDSWRRHVPKYINYYNTKKGSVKYFV